jgi:hypothetical protein
MTVKVHMAVLPLDVVAVIVALPLATLLTSPALFTETTEGLLDAQTTVWLVAFAGCTIAQSCLDVSAGDRKRDEKPMVVPGMLIVTPVAGTLWETAIVHVAVLLFDVFAVMVAVPTATAVTNPVLPPTVATAVLSEVQVTVLSVALLGNTNATSCFVSPIGTLAFV